MRPRDCGEYKAAGSLERPMEALIGLHGYSRFARLQRRPEAISEEPGICSQLRNELDWSCGNWKYIDDVDLKSSNEQK